MANYGTLYASFFDDDFNLITDTKTYHLPNTASGSNVVNQSGRGRFVMKLTTNVANMVKHGNYVTVYVNDTIASDNLLVCAFKINELDTETHGDGMTTLTASGYDELDELRLAYPHTRNIGAQFDTTLTYNALIGTTEITLDEIGSVETTVANQNTHPGEDHVRVASSTGFAVGDDVAIELNDPHGTHTTSITAIQNNPSGYLSFYLKDDMPHGSDIGLRIVKPEIFAGDDIRITLDDASYHRTKIDGDPGVNSVYLKEPIDGDDATAGNAARIHSSSLVDTSDITSIMAYATLDTWTLSMETGTGTANGTAHSPNGDSTLQLLIAAAKASGEFFRLERTSGSLPVRTLAWRRTSDSSGVTLVRSGAVANVIDANKGVIQSIKRSAVREIYTYMIATPTNGEFDLGDATDNDLSGNGTFSQEYIDNPPTWRIVHDANEAAYNPRWLVRQYDIEADSDSQASKTVAADTLQSTALAEFEAAEARVRTFDVVATVHKNLKVGQTIVVDYVEPQSLADYSGTYYITKLEPFVGPRDNVFRVMLQLSEDAIYRKKDDAQIIAAGLGNGSGGSTIVSGSSGGSGAGAAHDPVSLGTITPADAITLSEQELSFTATSDGYTNPSTVLAGDANGYASVARLGIGVTSPSYELHIDGAAYITDGGSLPTIAAATKFILGSTGGSGYNGAMSIIGGNAGNSLLNFGDTDDENAGIIFYNHASNYMTFRTNGSGEDMRIDIAGRVGIGNPSPSYKLDVTGDIRSSSVVYTNTIRDNSGADIVLQDDAGNVGIGVSPTYKLHVAGNVGFNGDLTFVGPQEINTTSGDITIAPAVDLNVNADLVFDSSRTISTAANSLTIAPTNDLILDPTGNNVFVSNDVDIGASGHVSGLYGSYWGIDTALGLGDFRALQTEELQAWVFHAVETLISSGDAVITKYSSRIAEGQPFTIPAVSSSGTIYFRDSESVGAGATHPEGGWVQLELTNFAQTDFLIARVWGQVYSYADQGDGTHTYTFTTRSSVFTTAGLVAKEGSAAVGWGLPGDPFIIWSLNDLAGAPYIRTGYWDGDNPYTASNRHLTTQTGNLSGLANLAGQNGFFAGRVDGANVAATDWGVSLTQVPISMYYKSSNDGFALRLHALELNGDVTTGIAPNGDISQDNVVRNSGTNDYYTYIDDDPASAPGGGDYIQNTAGENAEMVLDMEGIGASDTELFIEVYTQRNLTPDDDYCQLRAQLFKSDGTTELSDEIKVVTSDQATGLYTAEFTNYDTTATGPELAAARLKLRWVYQASTTGASEVTRLESSMETGPYLAIGNPLPDAYRTGSGVAGIWMGRDPSSNTYKFRVGGIASSGKPAFVYGDSGVRVIDSNDTDVIILDTSGASYFAGVMTIGTSGEIRQGTGTLGVDFDGLRLWRDSNIGRLSGYNGDDSVVSIDDNGISMRSVASSSDGWVRFLDSGDSVVGKFGFYENAGLNISAMVFNNTGNYSPGFIFTGSIDTTGGGDITSSGDLAVSGGIGVNTTSTPSTGQLILDQGAGDGEIITLKSSDVAHGMTTETETDTYGLAIKQSGTEGSLLIIGLGENFRGGSLYGYATNSTTTTSTSAVAPVMLRASLKSGTTVGAVGSTSNAVAMQSDTSTRWILKGNGDVYIDGTQNTYDAENDMQMSRALLRELNPIGFIQSAYDNLNPYSRDDLISLGLMSDGGFRNETRALTLALAQGWQLYERVKSLEAQIKELKQWRN